MNIDDLLNSAPVFGTLQEELKLVSDRFQLVGSRALIPQDDLKSDTDYDFIGLYSTENIEFIESLAFRTTPPIENNGYFDESTAAIYFHVGYNIQIVLKHGADWRAVQEMWEIFSNNRDFYKKYFWKSYPSSEVDSAHAKKNQIKERINCLLALIKTS